MDIEAWAALEEAEVPSLELVQRVVDYLKAADDAAIEDLFESKRVWMLFHHMEVVEEEADKGQYCLALQSAYLSAVKALMGKSPGLLRLCGEPALVGRLTLTLDSREVSICTQVLELLAVLAVTSEDGYSAVREAMEYFRFRKEERVRFESIVSALSSEVTPTHFKRDVMLFVNTLVNSAPDVEQRVEIRAELARAGVSEAIERLKAQSLELAGSGAEMSQDAYELEVQLQVFETVLENDHGECLASFSTDGREVRFDDPDSLFEAIKAHCLEYDCRPQLVELLQYLIAIPCFDSLGKEQWARILRSAHRALLGVDEDFVLGFDELKSLATWKQTLEKRATTIEELERKVTALEAKLKAANESCSRAASLRGQDTAGGGSSSAGTTLEGDSKYGKYFKMLRMHIPRPAVENKMRAEGLDPTILDEDPTKSIAASAAATATLAHDPKYEKYFKMLRMHIPRPAVEQKMQAEGIDPKILDCDVNSPPPPEETASGPPKLCEDPRYKKYFKMLQMHLPRPAVEVKMRAEGVDPKILDLDPNKAAPANEVAGPPLAKHPDYGKYFKKLKLHTPKPAIEAEMRANGHDPAVLSLDPNKPMPSDFLLKKGKIAPAPAKKDNRPKKANPKPRVPMRSLFWSKIEDRDKTVWKKLSDENVELPDEVLDSLEADFAKQRKDKDKDEKSTAAEKRQEEKKKEVTLVDNKVSQNVGIALHKLKMSKTEIRDAIVAVDEEKLDAAKCELLLKSCPTAEDMAAVNEFAGDASTLGRVEQFFREIAGIPDIKNRLECMLFKHKLESTFEVLDTRLKTVTVACEHVSRSDRLAKLLEVVLRLGNYINGGTGRGGVWGFKLDALAKLATIKSLDNTKTLMNWLVQWCQDNDPSLISFYDDFPEIDEAARCSLPQWTGDFGQLKTKIKLLDQHIAARRKQAPKGDRFVAVMTPFHERAGAEAEKLNRRFIATEQRFGELVGSFGEDPKTCGVEEFFKNLLGEFVACFNKARQQNEKRKAMEEKARQREQAAERRAALKAAGDNTENAVNDTLNGLKFEGAEDILAKIHGPRQRRQATRARQLAAASGEPPPSADSPYSDRLEKFVSRVQGVSQGSTAHHKLEAFRNRGHRRPIWNAPAPQNNFGAGKPEPPASKPAEAAPPPVPAAVTPDAGDQNSVLPPNAQPRFAPKGRNLVESQSELTKLTGDPAIPAIKSSGAPQPSRVSTGAATKKPSSASTGAGTNKHGSQSVVKPSSPPLAPQSSSSPQSSTAGTPKPSGGGELLKKLQVMKEKRKKHAPK